MSDDAWNPRPYVSVSVVQGGEHVAVMVVTSAGTCDRTEVVRLTRPTRSEVFDLGLTVAEALAYIKAKGDEL